MKKRWCVGLFIVLFIMYNQCGALSQGESSAKAACILEMETGRVLFEKNMHERLPMASTTKVMTALLAIENGDLADQVTCSRNAFGVSGTSIYLAEGETLTLEEMLKGLMLSSGNDAAVAIAEHIGGSVDGFAGMMNKRAKEIGANHTHFVNPHGLPDDEHYTTAYDLALIAREAMKNDVFRRIVSAKQESIPWEGRTYKRVLKNKNALLSSYEGATGIKTGFTSKAGRCLVFGAMREEMEIVGTVLSCAEWFDEAARLMDACFDQYDMTHMLGPLESAGEIPVVGGQKKSVSMCLTQELQLPLAQGENAQVVLEVPFSVQAPVYPGMPLGTARLVLDGQVLGESRIVADERVDVTGIGYNISRVIAGWMLLNRQ
ncbi:MAG: D-alanyl-D-alanine carboxypeptidase [Clostridia bacterium]|nr:D-alanyl-D-alanine carboxypeptidase [Clostridia bacterium]